MLGKHNVHLSFITTTKHRKCGNPPCEYVSQRFPCQILGAEKTQVCQASQKFSVSPNHHAHQESHLFFPTSYFTMTRTSQKIYNTGNYSVCQLAKSSRHRSVGVWASRFPLSKAGIDSVHMDPEYTRRPAILIRVHQAHRTTASPFPHAVTCYVYLPGFFCPPPERPPLSLSTHLQP
jgi:hypothetical protein